MKRLLKILGWAVGFLILLLVVTAGYVLLEWDRPIDRPVAAIAAPHDSVTIARGKYIYSVTWQCWSCHQGGMSDSNAPPSGGAQFDLRKVGPGFGVYYSRNITPDSVTGLGRWTDGEIVRAIREGVSRDRRMLFPIMPVDWLKDLSQEDALAIVAYLRSLPPVRHRVPDDEPSFFAKALVAFHVMAPPMAATVAPPQRGETAAYGRYFALNVAGCADCHTPRNLQDGKFFLDSLLAGSSIAYGQSEGSPTFAYARNITPHDGTGIGRWSEEEFAAAVTGGQRPDGTVLSAHMPYAHYKFLAPEDLRALYLFVRSLTPIARVTPPPGMRPDLVSARGADRGKLLFASRCSGCHGPEGKGAAPTNVRLIEVAGSIADADLRDFIMGGQASLRMPAFGKTLSATEVDDLIAYLRLVGHTAEAPSQ